MRLLGSGQWKEASGESYSVGDSCLLSPPSSSGLTNRTCVYIMFLKILTSRLDSIVNKARRNGETFLRAVPYETRRLPQNHRWTWMAFIDLWNYFFNCRNCVKHGRKKSKSQCAKSKHSILVDVAAFSTILAVENGSRVARSSLCCWDLPSKKQERGLNLNDDSKSSEKCWLLI